MNSFKTQRLERLQELLDQPHVQDGELVQELSDFVEAEIASAYGRGYRHGQEPDKHSAPRDGKFPSRRRFAERAK